MENQKLIIDSDERPADAAYRPTQGRAFTTCSDSAQASASCAWIHDVGVDVGTVLAAVASSTVVATSVSAAVTWKIASRQHEVDKQKLAHEQHRLQHELAEAEYQRRQRVRDDARSLCQQVVGELAFMAASMTLLNDNWRWWEEHDGSDPKVREVAAQLYDDVNKTNADMPALISAIMAASHEVLPEAAWGELNKTLIGAQQTYGHVILDVLSTSEFPNEARQAWLAAYGVANMTAHRLMTEIG